MSKSSQRKTTGYYQILKPKTQALQIKWADYLRSPNFGGWIENPKGPRPVVAEGGIKFAETCPELIDEYNKIADRMTELQKFVPSFFKHRLICY
jgi:hypothetical protein